MNKFIDTTLRQRIQALTKTIDTLKAEKAETYNKAHRVELNDDDVAF